MNLKCNANHLLIITFVLLISSPPRPHPPPPLYRQYKYIKTCSNLVNSLSYNHLVCYKNNNKIIIMLKTAMVFVHFVECTTVHLY